MKAIQSQFLDLLGANLIQFIIPRVSLAVFASPQF